MRTFGENLVDEMSPEPVMLAEPPEYVPLSSPWCRSLIMLGRSWVLYSKCGCFETYARSCGL